MNIQTRLDQTIVVTQGVANPRREVFSRYPIDRLQKVPKDSVILYGDLLSSLWIAVVILRPDALGETKRLKRTS